MSFFGRYLAVWEFLYIVVGALLEVPVMLLMVANSSTTPAPGTKPRPAS
jgi:hypothetical protein